MRLYLGAQIYFFHFIFHDWSDDCCHRILSQISVAMISGYSKLILGEFVLQDTRTPFLATGFDLQMMALHSGTERSERQWQTLLHGVGLEVARVAFPQGNKEGVIEAMKKGNSSKL